MNLNRHYQLLLVVGLLLPCALNGCGGPSKTTFDPTGQHKMTEIGQMLAAVKAYGDSPPSSLDELEQIEPLVPLSAEDLRSGNIIYFWGAGLSSDGKAASTILAHEKQVATDGGWVLMQNGTVKQMTPDRFSAHSKAK